MGMKSGILWIAWMSFGIVFISGCETLNIPRDPLAVPVKESVYDLDYCKLDYPEPWMEPWHCYMQSPETGRWVDMEDLPKPDNPCAGLIAWWIGWQNSPFEPVK